MVLTWGDPIKIKQDSPFGRAGNEGDVVGIWEIESESQSAAFDLPIGEPIYLIEYGDGSAEEVPGRFVEPVPYDRAKWIRHGDIVMVYPDSPFGRAGQKGKVIWVGSVSSSDDEKIFERPVGEALFVLRYEEGRDDMVPLAWVERVWE